MIDRFQQEVFASAEAYQRSLRDKELPWCGKSTSMQLQLQFRAKQDSRGKCGQQMHAPMQ
jgi:hypothetical protein